MQYFLELLSHVRLISIPTQEETVTFPYVAYDISKETNGKAQFLKAKSCAFTLVVCHR